METPKSEKRSARPDPEELKELLEKESDSADDMPRQGNGSLSSRGLDFLYDVPLQVSVEVGRCKILLKDLLSMSEGYVIELEKLAGEPLDLFVNSRLIAHGEAVLVGEKFGIRLTDVVSTSDRVEKLG
ncbi:flagellar motor switch protein FliN [Desulfopila inferna]|uniref:flagellar motor switch protein FliN n=1 Tax=Desulfopila inferna TaxID=468528 RepID=UPI00196279B6|nr:flagellar motor switch protein FliN [Desulfopila inferna]MBM9602982.1 flagellar motor switch protein FliN [Desulfopila inferna]